MEKSQKGFTLVELMSVVAIVGILTAIALPMYQGYTVRTRVSEMAVLAASARLTVTESITTHNAVDARACEGVNMASATSNTASMTCNLGVLVFTGSPSANNIVLTYTPAIGAGGRVDWTCTSDPAARRFVPIDCR